MKVRYFAAVLFSPGSFFEDHPPMRTLGGAAVAVLVTALVTAAAFAAVGIALGGAIDASVTVTTVEPLPESVCDNYDSSNLSVPEGCTIDEPRTKQVDVGTRVRGAFFGKLPILFVASFVGWILVAVALHLVSALGDARGSFGATLSVAGWSAVPALVGGLLGLGVLYFNVQTTEFASDPAVLAEQVRRLADRTGGFSVLTSLVGVGWQAVVWTYGLHHGRNLDYRTAAFAAGVVGVVVFLVGL